MAPIARPMAEDRSASYNQDADAFRVGSECEANSELGSPEAATAITRKLTVTGSK